MVKYFGIQKGDGFFKENKEAFDDLLEERTRQLTEEIEIHRETVARLKRVEQRYQGVFKYAPLMMCAFGGDQNLFDVNFAWLNNLGYEYDDVVGKKVVNFLTPQSEDCMIEVVLPAVCENGVVQDVSLQFVKSDGSLMEVLLSAVAGVDDDGELFDVLAVMIDVTESKKLEDIKVNLLSDAAHEMRTPLAIMRMNLDLAVRNKFESDEEFDGMVETLRGEVGYLSCVVDDLSLLAQSHAEAREQLAFELLSLEDLVLRVWDQFVEAAKHKSIDFKFGDLSGMVVFGDQNMLERLLQNVLSNAVRYSSKKGFIKLSAKFRNGDIFICVEDNGRGIKKDYLSSIFERFFRVDKSRNRMDGGAGLGLAVCKWIVEVHGGKISVESRYGKGSKFIIALPRASKV